MVGVDVCECCVICGFMANYRDPLSHYINNLHARLFVSARSERGRNVNGLSGITLNETIARVRAN